MKIGDFFTVGTYSLHKYYCRITEIGENYVKSEYLGALHEFKRPSLDCCDPLPFRYSLCSKEENHQLNLILSGNNDFNF